MTRGLRITGALLLSTLAVPLLGHDTWVSPGAFHPMAGQATVLHLTSGMAFPKLEYAIQADRIARATIRCGDSKNDLERKRTDATSLMFDARCPSDAFGVVAIELAPKRLELTEKQVAEYLDEIGQRQALGPIWKAMPSPRRWREEYTKHAKTVIEYGRPSGNSWSVPVGMRLEIVPETDPLHLEPGGTMTVRLLENGRPLADFSLAVTHEGEGPQFVTTDRAGRAEVRLPSAGGYLLAATHLRRSAKRDLEWESDFSTLTITVAPR